MKIFFLKCKTKDFLFRIQNQGQHRSCKASPAFIPNWKLSARISHQWSIDTGTRCKVLCVWRHQHSYRWSVELNPILRDHLNLVSMSKENLNIPLGRHHSFFLQSLWFCRTISMIRVERWHVIGCLDCCESSLLKSFPLWGTSTSFLHFMFLGLILASKPLSQVLFSR